MSATTAHAFSFDRLDGQGPLPLAEFAGRPVLVVNTASRCGYTSQYEELQALHRHLGPHGLVVLAVPSNDFGAQEPGSAAEIGAFCRHAFGVEFPMAAKAAVTGPDAHPFFLWLAETAGEAAAPRWNFHKYLIGKDGALLGCWPSAVRPASQEVVGAIQAALAA